MGVSSFGAGGQPESRNGSQPDLPSTVQDAPELGCTGCESARIPRPYSPSDGRKLARRTSNGHHPNRVLSASVKNLAITTRDVYSNTMEGVF